MSVSPTSPWQGRAVIKSTRYSSEQTAVTLELGQNMWSSHTHTHTPSDPCFTLIETISSTCVRAPCEGAGSGRWDLMRGVGTHQSAAPSTGPSGGPSYRFLHVYTQNAACVCVCGYITQPKVNFDPNIICNNPGCSIFLWLWLFCQITSLQISLTHSCIKQVCVCVCASYLQVLFLIIEHITNYKNWNKGFTAETIPASYQQMLFWVCFILKIFQVFCHLKKFYPLDVFKRPVFVSKQTCSCWEGEKLHRNLESLDWICSWWVWAALWRPPGSGSLRPVCSEEDSCEVESLIKEWLELPKKRGFSLFLLFLSCKLWMELLSFLWAQRCLMCCSCGSKKTLCGCFPPCLLLHNPSENLHAAPAFRPDQLGLSVWH